MNDTYDADVDIVNEVTVRVERTPAGYLWYSLRFRDAAEIEVGENMPDRVYFGLPDYTPKSLHAPVVLEHIRRTLELLEPLETAVWALVARGDHPVDVAAQLSGPTPPRAPYPDAPTDPDAPYSDAPDATNS